MKKRTLLLSGLVFALIFAGCKDPGGSSSSSGGRPRETVTAGSASFDMIYVQNQNSVTFPTSEDDSTTQTLTTKFFMSETEVTNAVVAEVYQWAYDNAKFSSTVTDPNGLDATTAKHGGQELIDLDDSMSGGSYCKINYAGGQFTVDNGYDDHPVVMISWYGAVIFCNWLTEMRDGNASNVVHKWVDDGSGGGTANDGIWQHGETTEDVAKNGYRLPQRYEWEYAARYRSGSTNTVSGYSNPWYTKGNSASDAVDDYSNATATGAVAWYTSNSGNQLHAVGDKRINDLELFDMSGNVWEWCFTQDGSNRVGRGGGWDSNADDLQVGSLGSDNPLSEYSNLGFRLCRTK